jgi:hypothetical protein
MTQFKVGDRVRLKGFAMDDFNGQAIYVEGRKAVLEKFSADEWLCRTVEDEGGLRVTPSQCRRLKPKEKPQLPPVGESSSKLVSEPVKPRVWSCKIGGVDTEALPPGADWPLRQAVKEAYFKLTGKESDFCFSGWGAELTEDEAAVAERLAPVKPRGSPAGEETRRTSPGSGGGAPLSSSEPREVWIDKHICDQLDEIPALIAFTRKAWKRIRFLEAPPGATVVTKETLAKAWDRFVKGSGYKYCAAESGHFEAFCRALGLGGGE